jgi:hypothetical protein
MGRGLTKISDKAERILLNMNIFMENRKYTCLRKRAILEKENKSGTMLAIIKEFLREKYDLKEQELTCKLLIEKQKEKLLQKINKKVLHGELFEAQKSNLNDIKTSSCWLSKGNNSPQAEGLYCYMQDRNMFFGENKGSCNHCKERMKSVDHLATQCSRMLYYDYTWRHNEVVRCIHLLLCRKYGLKNTKKLRTHKVSSILENEKVLIKVDTVIKTDIIVLKNKPDIVVFDKKQKTITIIEVGVTSQDRLQVTETEKLRKYDLLANELKSIYKSKVEIIPIALIWDGIVKPPNFCSA